MIFFSGELVFAGELRWEKSIAAVLEGLLIHDWLLKVGAFDAYCSPL